MAALMVLYGLGRRCICSGSQVGVTESIVQDRDAPPRQSAACVRHRHRRSAVL